MLAVIRNTPFFKVIVIRISGSFLPFDSSIVASRFPRCPLDNSIISHKNICFNRFHNAKREETLLFRTFLLSIAFQLSKTQAQKPVVYVIRPLVVMLQIVGVLPKIQSDQRLKAAYQGIILIVRGHDLQLPAPVRDQPRIS